jgi:hypothetical protein
MSSAADLLARFEELIRCDPAGRGILSTGEVASRFGVGHLAAAAGHLAEYGREVALVTGFAVPTARGPVAETDGPPGAVLLAATCAALGMQVHILTDDVCAECLRAAAEFAGLASSVVAACPVPATDGAAWCDRFLARHPHLTHLIAVERVGPSHTPQSYRRRTVAGAADDSTFEQHVPKESHDRCFNMRGEPIDAFTAPLHLLFDRVAHAAPAARTVGIGDGGNEIGMGAFDWEDLHPLISGGHGPRIVCRIATDWTILAGTSNWGASALAAALAVIRDRTDLLRDWTVDRYETLLNHIVRHGPAVDGVTREPQPSVDGLPFATYIQPWAGIRATLGQYVWDLPAARPPPLPASMRTNMPTSMSLREWLEDRNLTPAELAERAGVDVKLVDAIVAGRYTTSPQQRERIATALGVSAAAIRWGNAVGVDHMYGHGPQFGRSP